MCINCHLNWGDHATITSRETSRMLNMLQMYNSNKSMKKLVAVTTPISPDLECCAPIWSLHLIKIENKELDMGNKRLDDMYSLLI